MSTALGLPPRDMTVAEFLDWADATEGMWQLRDGEPEAMSPGSLTHGGIQAELVALLVRHLRDAGSPCRVVVAPGVVPRLRSDRNMLVPDIGITCGAVDHGRAMTEPRVLIEILSPSNARQTRANLWAYATIPSVAEIVVISSTAIAAEVLRQRPDGAWPERPELLGAEDRLRIPSIGFEAPLRELYRGTPLAAEGA